jgi:hypothetical protein
MFTLNLTAAPIVCSRSHEAQQELVQATRQGNLEALRTLISVIPVLDRFIDELHLLHVACRAVRSVSAVNSQSICFLLFAEMLN